MFHVKHLFANKAGFGAPRPRHRRGAGGAVKPPLRPGGFAAAPVAIGDQTAGDIQIDVHAAHSSALLIREAIRTRFPNTPQFLIDFFSLF